MFVIHRLLWVLIDMDALAKLWYDCGPLRTNGTSRTVHNSLVAVTTLAMVTGLAASTITPRFTVGTPDVVHAPALAATNAASSVTPL